MASRRYLTYPVVLLSAVLLVFNGVDGKERFGKGIGRNLYFLQDTLKRNQDTLKKHLQDSLAKDSLRKGSLSGPAFSGANDSIIEKNVEGRKMIYYYHDANVKYLNFELKAAYMEYDIDNKIVLAKGLPDTSGVIQGKPVMTMDGRSYTMDQVIYNFNTGKSRMYNLITQQDEGFLHGDKLKMLPDHSINISGGKYTVCDLDHPHFYLKMPVARVVTGDNPLTVFGPSYLVLEDVPTPFFLPFGFVPKMKNRAGGLLIPNYGEEVSRGFFMKGLGYYFVLGNNLDLSVTGDIYSMGSWNLLVTSRYKKRYKYDGTFSMNISNNQVGEKGGPDFVQSRDFSLQWNHTQDSKARPGTSFSASVNFSSPSNNRYNSTSIQTTLQNQISSSVSYSRTWAGTPLSFSANALHNQNSLDSSYSISFPSMRFNVSTIYPFRNYKSAGKRKFYEDISFAYNTTLENNVKFKASQVKDPDFMSLFKSGMKHNFQIGLPTFSVLKYLQFSPSIAYGMNWYFQQTTKEYDTETGEVVDKMSDLFSSFGTTHDFSAGLSGNTRITGIFNLGKKFYIQKIRHLITPSVGFSFRPEMGTSWNGYRKYSYIDNNGEQHILSYNKYAGQLNSPPSTGRSAAITFSLMNNFEGKVADPQDTTGGGFKVIKLIDNLSLSGNYNLLADSLKLSNISATMSTTVFGKLSVNANANLDPYAIDEKGNKINTFNIVKKGGLNFARLMNASMSFSYQFSGEGKGGGGGSAPAQNNDSNQGNTSGNTSKSDFGGVKTEEILYKRIYYHPVTGEYIPGGWVYYLEPDIPWSVNINYSMSYSKSYSYASSLLTTKNNYIQTLGFGFQLRPTKALNFNLNSGYDISNKKLTTTQLSATYDLHCFVITFSWIPQGQWQSWSFRINAKASALADLLQFKKNASYWDRTQ